jgi:HlyD family secretion protein
MQVKLGISDGISTEVLEGINESDIAVTGVVSTQPSASPAGGNSPLSGGGRRF